ncbi:hypothetical protein AAEX63_14165 [Luteococcus sp. H138]|uniref:hypothetical protein n=1 Tax=unclassified Luteococcus TaxID=2639923 RepID=UPI00313BE285
MRGTDEVRALLQANGGVLKRSNHPELRGSIDWMLRSPTKEVVRLLPGVIAASAVAEDFTVRVKAVMLWQPDAIITGDAAARLDYWPEHQADVIDVIVPHFTKPAPGVRVHRVALPLDHMVETEGIRRTHPAWTSVWLAEQDGGDAIDEAFRRKEASLEEVQGALGSMSRQTATNLRRFVVANSAENPWSHPERQWHMMLRAHGVTGWIGNLPVVIGGVKMVLDAGMPELKIDMEVQSFEHHTDHATFYKDQSRIANLVANGWTYFPVTVPMIEEESTVMAQLFATMERCRRELGLPPGPDRARVARREVTRVRRNGKWLHRPPASAT